MMNGPPPRSPKRSINSLSREECRGVFALAFGYAPTDHTLVIDHRDYALISDGTLSIIIHPTGDILSIKSDFSAAQFNALKVMSYLFSLNIDFLL